MSTLLLRLAAPIQSWGVASKFDTRDTAREPSKSGVIGLLAAAQGRSRVDELDDLKELRFGVRIDQPGTILRDFHTAHLSRRPDEPPFVTIRYYLSDAVFLVGLEGAEDFLQTLTLALQNPVFPLYLGRRSCPPTGQLVLGLREPSLLQALQEEPWQASAWYVEDAKKRSETIKLTIVYDAAQGEEGSFLRRDLPITFDQRHRQYGFRMVKDIADGLAVQIPQLKREIPTEHDAMAGLEGD